MFADICLIMPRAIASSRSLWICGDVYFPSLFQSHSMISEPVVSAADENWSSPQTLFQCSSLLIMPKPVALSIGCWTGLRAKSFFSCAFLGYVVQIANHQYHLLLLLVPWHILQLPPYANQTICAFEIFSFFHCIFQLENQFFVKAGSVLGEVSIPLWSVFKQVWQQATSLL